MYINSAQLSPLENFSSTAYATKPLSDLNQSGFLLLGAVSARVLSCVVIPLTAIVDSTIHMSCFAGKMCTGVVITPYNTIAGRIAPNWKAPRDLEISSAFIHLMRMVECVFTAAILPFVCLINPDRAYDFMSHRYGLHEKDRQKHVHNLDQQVRDLQQQVRDKDATESALRAQLFSFSGAEVARLRSEEARLKLEQELTALKMELEELKKARPSKDSTPSNQGTNPTPPNSTPQKSKIPEPPKVKIPEPPKQPPKPNSKPTPTKNPPKPNKETPNSTAQQTPTKPPLPTVTDDRKNLLDAIRNRATKPAEKVEVGIGSKGDISLLAIHEKLLQDPLRRTALLQKTRPSVEAVIEYLESDEKNVTVVDLDEWDEDIQIAPLLTEYCRGFHLNFDDMAEKPMTKISEDRLEHAKKYFNFFAKQIEEATKVDPQKRLEAERQREEHERLIRETNEQKAAEALEKRKNALLKDLRFLNENSLTTAIEKHLNLIEKGRLNAAFERGNKAINPSYKNFEEFEQSYNELIQRIHSLASEDQIQPLRETQLYKNVGKVLGEISTELRDKAFSI
ncbi:hypothetical protein [Candidatus Protochlamydia phocaeensis]|uniref:hypothetical protein n=1 Tax=Candidatus Protochlamydia phocaeensis TaxID=1414722 RepID=UPI0008392195|nr:hypothetical protein [Candidatus Protochlamydia phocaeensis]